MSHAAAALARVDTDWTADDLELDDVEDLDGLVELAGQVGGDEADVTLVFVEENDEWFGVVRVDADGEPRIFVSDARVIETSAIAELLAEGVADPEVLDGDDDDVAGVDDDEEVDPVSAESEPAGDTALLADLGTPAARLLALCNQEGQLPSDVISALCEAAGCLDVLDKLRGV